MGKLSNRLNPLFAMVSGIFKNFKGKKVSKKHGEIQEKLVKMLKNNLKQDYKDLCKIQGRTMMEASAKCGMNRSNMNRMFETHLVNWRFIRLVEELGYDIEVDYVER